MLISRRSFPPNGFRFFEPKTGWPKNPIGYFAGKHFDQVVEEVIQHRLKNPRWANQWATDFETVANEVDNYTSFDIGMDPNYCTGGVAPSFPQSPPPPLSSGQNANGVGVVVAAKKVIAGIGVLLDWLGSGGKSVPNEQAEARARVCSDCPKNRPGNLTDWFTIPASERIRRQLEIRNDMKLATTFDDRLNVCEACLCPLRLKVHTPIKYVLEKLTPEGKAALDERCWMLAEEKQLTEPPPEESHANQDPIQPDQNALPGIAPGSDGGSECPPDLGD